MSLKTENKHFARRRGGKPPCHTFGSTLFCCSERCAGGFNVEGEGWDPSLGSPPPPAGLAGGKSVGHLCVLGRNHEKGHVDLGARPICL